MYDMNALFGTVIREGARKSESAAAKKETTVFAFSAEERKELEAEGYHVVTDSDHFAGGEV